MPISTIYLIYPPSIMMNFTAKTQLHVKAKELPYSTKRYRIEILSTWIDGLVVVLYVRYAVLIIKLMLRGGLAAHV